MMGLLSLSPLAAATKEGLGPQLIPPVIWGTWSVLSRTVPVKILRMLSQLHSRANGAVHLLQAVKI